MTIQLNDPSTEPADFKRDRWGRPSIMQPDGKRKSYTRCSSAAKTIEDTYNLTLWSKRNVAYGLAHDASLVARVLAIGGEPSTWDKVAKDAVNEIVSAAEAVAKAHKAADIGTAVHRLTEQLDRGEPVTGGIYQPDLDAYRMAMDAAGFDVAHIECRMVNDELEMAGTADRIVSRRTGGHAIADVKTSATVDFGGLGWAAQLAAYAGGLLYDCAAEQRLDTPDLDITVGYIIHLPAGQGRCAVYEVDLEGGLAAARLANEVRAIRKVSKGWLRPLTATPIAPAQPDRRAVLMTRYKALNAADQQRFVDAKSDRGIDGGDLDAVEALLDEIDPFMSTHVEPGPAIEPAPERPTLADHDVDEGETIDADEPFDKLAERFAALDEGARQVFHRLELEARGAGRSFLASKTNGKRTQRRHHIYDGLIGLLERDLVEDELVRLLVATAMQQDGPMFPVFTLGEVLGALNAHEALRFAELSFQAANEPASLELRQRPASTTTSAPGAAA